MSLLSRPWEVACFEWAIQHCLGLGYRDGARIYIQMLDKYYINNYLSNGRLVAVVKVK
jgi:hypothetical protein